MKRLFHIFFLLLISAGAAMFSSCKKNVTVVPFIFSTPLQALLNSDTTLSVFYAIAKKSGDSLLYAGTDSVTVLVLTNEALALQGITASTVGSISAASADSILRYYFIAGYDSLTVGTYTFYNKLGSAIYGYADSSGNTYFNGIPATRQSLQGSNATVFKLGTPLIPAISAASLIASDSSLSFFAEALKHTNLSLTPASGWNTVLAPVDTAFTAAGYPTLGSIDSADVATLTNLLQYHILPGQYFNNSFTGLLAVTTLQGSSINLTFNNDQVQFTGNGNITPAMIVLPNRIVAGNIILQNITGVLMP